MKDKNPLMVETRECKDCKHHKRLFDGSICRKHLMAVCRDMHVSYYKQVGSCFTKKIVKPKDSGGQDGR